MSGIRRGSSSSGLPAPRAGAVTDGGVTLGRKGTGSALDVLVWPVGGDVQGSTGVQAELSG